VSSIAAKPTCVVADDHPPVLESIARYLGAHGYRIVGLARNGEEAVTLIESLRPSLAVLDLRMPGLSGADVVRQVARTTPQCGSVVYSGFGDSALLDEALDAGSA
jgi:DNA-binding NarL/FixJ family response regulator